MVNNIYFNPSAETPGFFAKMFGGSKMNYTLIFIICSVIFALAAYFYYSYYMSSTNSKLSYTANNEHNTDGRNGKNVELLFFFANWCPHCKAAKPAWEDIKNQYENQTVNGYKIVFVEVDCSAQSEESEKLMDKYDVDGFPTIKLVKDGQVIDFDAKPSSENFNKFFNTVL